MTREQAGAAGRPEPSGVDFARIEREHVRNRLYPLFDWLAFDTFSPLHPMSIKLENARVALVSTAGAHVTGQEPFDTRSPAGDPSFRAIPSDVSLEDVRLAHAGYDTRTAASDVQVVLPLDHLRERVRAGRIGAITPTIYSTIGFVADPAPLIEITGPAIVTHLRDERPDLVLLAPA